MIHSNLIAICIPCADVSPASSPCMDSSSCSSQSAGNWLYPTHMPSNNHSTRQDRAKPNPASRHRHMAKPTMKNGWQATGGWWWTVSSHQHLDDQAMSILTALGNSSSKQGIQTMSDQGSMCTCQVSQKSHRSNARKSTFFRSSARIFERTFWHQKATLPNMKCWDIGDTRIPESECVESKLHG